jgi:CheY-like chemotaxis protein
MNLMSNALKFTPKSGKITIRANWCLTKSPEILTEIKNPHVFSEHHEGSFSEVPAEETTKNFQTDAFEEFSFSEGISRIHNFTKLHSESKFCHSSSYDNASWTIIRVPSLSSSSEVTQKTGYLKVQISDSGCGIAQEEISSLFGMFNQVRTEARHVSGGTGLGLWICKQLCQKMNGEITVYSKVNQGTSFVFYIPASREKVYGEYPGGQQKRDKVNALVVDDLEFNRNLHKVLLEREGVQVTLASDGEEAVEKYKRKGQDYFDFIMMDAQMPGIDGFGAATMIREWEDAKKFNKVDIYFVSGEYFNEAEVISELKKQGRTQDFGDIKCLRKPVDIHIIGNIVESVRTKLNLRNSRRGGAENLL